jgi:hypothetical protein
VDRSRGAHCLVDGPTFSWCWMVVSRSIRKGPLRSMKAAEAKDIRLG